MKILSFITCFLLCMVIGYCQTLTKDPGTIINSSNITFISGNHLPDSFLESDNRVLSYSDIEGSPYIDNFSGANNNLPIGKFYSVNLEYINTAFIRYNAYTNDMEVSKMEDGVDYYLLKKIENSFYIVLKKKTYRAYKYNKGLGYFVILSENDNDQCTLLMKEEIVFKKGEKPQSSFLSDTENRFQKLKNVLYFKLNNTIIEIPKKKKAFYAIFGEKKKTMVAFIESEKLKINKEKNLLAIATYYNSLSH